MKKILYLIAIIFISFSTSCTHSKQNKVEESYEQETHTVVSDSESTTEQKDDNKEEITTEQSTGDVNIYIPNGKTPQQIIDVFLNDALFTWVQAEANINGEKLPSREMKLSQYNYLNGDFFSTPVKLGSYRVVDLDMDGYNEVIVYVPSTDALVFSYNNHRVYAYAVSFRGLANITTSGIVRGSSGESYYYDYRIQFAGETYTVKLLSLMDGDKYYLNGESVTEDKYWKYLNELNNQEEVPDWTDYEELLNTR